MSASSAPRPPPERRLAIRGAVGPLEARLRSPRSSDSIPAAAVLFHPHPQHGGRLDSKVLYRIAKGLPTAADVPALRINFRGVGSSEGRYDGGVGEREDALAAVDWLARRHPGRPIAAIGFSFGAVVGLRAAAGDERVRWLVALGLPLDGPWEIDFLRRTRKPRLFVQGEFDRFGDADRMRRFVSGLPGPTTLRLIRGADHLFRHQEDAAASAVVDYIRRSVDPGEQDRDG